MMDSKLEEESQEADNSIGEREREKQISERKQLIRIIEQFKKKVEKNKNKNILERLSELSDEEYEKTVYAILLALGKGQKNGIDISGARNIMRTLLDEVMNRKRNSPSGEQRQKDSTIGNPSGVEAPTGPLNNRLPFLLIFNLFI